jgi:hypothetical protein
MAALTKKTVPKKKKTPTLPTTTPSPAKSTGAALLPALLVAATAKAPTSPPLGGAVEKAVAPSAADTTPTSTPQARTTGTSPAQPAASTVGPAPNVVMPTPPDGYSRPGRYAFTGYAPSPRMLAAIPQAIADLEAFTDMVTVLGPLAPSGAVIADALGVGLSWRPLIVPSDVWAAYVGAQNGKAWKTASQLLAELKPFFLAATAKSAQLAQKYQGLTELLNAAKVSAQQGAATKRANKAKAKKQAVAASAATTAPATEAPVTTGPKQSS